MLLSLSAGKSRSSWLDRLWTTKGFPESTATDLENFLQNPIPPSNERLEDPKPNPHPIPHPTQNEDKQLLDMMSNVLNELFNFGDTCTNSAKFRRSARKQANPRICAFSNDSSHENNNGASEKVTLLRSGDSNSGVEGVKVLDRCQNEGEGAEKDANLAGFSRTEVTVIDTSYEMWKFEKLLYRKKNVWKVRDKKGKSSIVGSKRKRKVSGGMEEDQHGGKKSNIDKKEGSAEQCELPSNEAHKPEVHEKEAPNTVSGTLKKKQVDVELENGSSSIILIKSIHSGKRNGTSLPKGKLKLKQKKT